MGGRLALGAGADYQVVRHIGTAEEGLATEAKGWPIMAARVVATAVSVEVAKQPSLLVLPDLWHPG